MSAPQTACMAAADVNHPGWCDPELCVTYPSGDRVHCSQPGYWITSDYDFELRVIQIHDAGASTPDAPFLSVSTPDPPFLSLSIPTRKGEFRLDEGFELTPTEARGLAIQLLTYAQMLGE